MKGKHRPVSAANLDRLTNILRRRFPGGTITPEEMRRALVETSLPAELEPIRADILRSQRSRPPVPEGAPQSWLDALFTPGVCVLPLQDVNGVWRFCLFNDGALLIDGRTEKPPSFESYDEAAQMGAAWLAYRKKSNPGE